MADRSLKAVEQVAFGDLVMTHMDRGRKVIGISKRTYTGEMVSIEVETVTGSGPLVCTADHPLAFPGMILRMIVRWSPANSFRVGDTIYVGAALPRNERKITSISLEEVSGVDVYDFEVEEDHSFLAGGICVHNSYGLYRGDS